MHRIVVRLPENRDYAGQLTIEGPGGKLIAGPFEACGRANDQLARINQNPARDPLLPFGDTPLGRYHAVQIIPSGPGTSYGSDEFGSAGIVLLQPRHGEVVLADANGRFGFFIHGGAAARNGALRPTEGSLRLSNRDQRKFVAALRKLGSPPCECAVMNLKGRKRGRAIAVASARPAPPPRRAARAAAPPPLETTRRSWLRLMLLAGASASVPGLLLFSPEVAAAEGGGDYQQPTPEPMPEDQHTEPQPAEPPNPEPAPEPNPEPAPAPEPNPEPNPTPPEPAPEPNPEPAPEPNPEPAPAPEPMTDQNPEPQPSEPSNSEPNPAPPESAPPPDTQPAPEPAPEPASEPNSAPNPPPPTDEELRDAPNSPPSPNPPPNQLTPFPQQNAPSMGQPAVQNPPPGTDTRATDQLKSINETTPNAENNGQGFDTSGNYAGHVDSSTVVAPSSGTATADTINIPPSMANDPDVQNLQKYEQEMKRDQEAAAKAQADYEKEKLANPNANMATLLNAQAKLKGAQDMVQFETGQVKAKLPALPTAPPAPPPKRP